MVARAANRIFVGDELCKSLGGPTVSACTSLANVGQGRNNDYIESSISYVTQVSTSGLLLNLFPKFLKRAAGVGLTIPIRIFYSQCSKHLRPIFEELTRTQSAGINECTSSARLFSSWLVSNSAKLPIDSLERTPDYLCRRIMALNFAAIHTSTLTTCNLILDVFSNTKNAKNNCATSLLDECLASSNRWKTTWNRARLNQMLRLDSALRESLRLWGITAKALSRKVIAPRGAMLPNGQWVPQGLIICISGWGLHHDERMYPQPLTFVPDRFMRSLDDTEHSAQVTRSTLTPEKKIKNTGTAAAETDDHFATWGIGKHACLGRFFAVDLIKIILTYILINYEVEASAERPENLWIEYNVIPPPSATLPVRRRKSGSVWEM